MASASDYVEVQTAKHWFGLTPDAAPTSVFVALFTSAPSDAGGGTEVTGNAYARVELDNDSTSWILTNSTITNKIAVTFPEPSPSAWGTVTHWAIFDAASGGNLLFHAPLTNARVTVAGVALSFAIGQMAITVD